MLATILDPTSGVAIVLQVLIILGALLLGTRYGGIGASSSSTTPLSSQE